MTNSEVRFPGPLRAALREGNLVVFAGAGVSMGKPACLPRFRKLARSIAEGTGETQREQEPEDVFLGRLHQKGIRVHARAAEKLLKNRCGEIPRPTALHRDLLRLYPEPETVRIVTTNFDLLFEEAAPEVFRGRKPELYKAPALPLGRSFNGIVHPHGCIEHPAGMVLTDADFGRAYLTDGWARRFLVELFRSSTVMFVGYSHDDTVMKYLVRALPESETQRRFAMVEYGDGDKWPALGITPVFYPRKPGDDHPALMRGIRELADYTRRGLLDWRHEITEIARRPPSLDESEYETIDEALADPTKLRFFTEAATDPEWLDWLDERKHLSTLFESGTLGERDTQLSGWLVDRFAFDHPDAFFVLIGRHDMRLNRWLWNDLTQAVAFRNHPALDGEMLSRWVSCLLATAPPLSRMHLLLSLAQRCDRAGLVHSMIEIFDAMAAHRVCVKPPFLEFGDELADHPDFPRQEIDLELSPDGDNSDFNELWESVLKPKLEAIADPLLSSVVVQLAARHRTFLAWQEADRDWDPESLGRDAIETDEESPRFQHVDVLIDAARDCLQWLARNRPETAARWCAQLAGSGTPLLRRLAVHTLTVRNDLSACEKLDWLFDNTGLHDDAATHELFEAIQRVYSRLDAGRRERVIQTISAFRLPGDGGGQDGRRIARYQFEWLRCIRGADPGCIRAQQAVDAVTARFPEFNSREEADRQRLWTVDELLSRPAHERLDELLSFRERSVLGPDRHDLFSIVTNAAKREFRWGADLADALADREMWDADLWIALFRAWREAGLTDDQIGEVFRYLGETGLSESHTSRVADLLLAWLEQVRPPVPGELLGRANSMATRLWTFIERDEVPDAEDSWHFAATGRPAGSLARYWLKQRSILREQPDAFAKTSLDEVRAAFSMIVQDRSVAGRQGSAVLAGQLAFLFDAEEEWSRANLLPRFRQDPGTDDYQAVWDGFLTRGHLTTQLGPLLKDAFLEALPHILGRFGSGKRVDGFVHRCTAMLAYFADDPIEEWIPPFFVHASAPARVRFASEVEHHLRHMDDARQREWWDRWLERYWKNRLDGIPEPLADDEIRLMIGWLPSFKSLFSTAVEVAVRMRSVPLSTNQVIYDLWRGNHGHGSPEAVAMLLIHMGEHASRDPTWNRAKDLIVRLLSNDLPDDFHESLVDLLARIQ